MPKYLSGRVKRTPQSGLSTDRYQYLDLAQAEPNIGDPPDPLPSIPVGQQFQLVSLREKPGERYWVPITGGLIPGSITVREQGTVVPSGGISSVTDINFKGDVITVTGYTDGDGNPGTAVTVTVAPPGLDHQILFNNSNEFAGGSYFVYDNSTVGIASVGIGTSSPTQNLHIVGNLRLTGTLYDTNNAPGNQSDLLVKNASGGVEWIRNEAVISGAGGTISEMQYHDDTGLVNGASNFVWIESSKRVGIGSTQPAKLLDVLGDTRLSQLEVTGVSTFTGIIDANGGADISGGSGLVASTAKVSDLTSGRVVYVGSGGELQDSSNLTYDGGTLTGYYAEFTGIVTTGFLKLGGNTVNTTAGNLILDSSAGTIQAEDKITILASTSSIDKDTGSLVTQGGVGIEENLNVGGNTNISGRLNISGITTLASSGGITTTGGDLWVGGDLYVEDDIVLDEARVQSLIVNPGVSTFRDVVIGSASTVGFGTTAYFVDWAKLVFGSDDDTYMMHTGEHQYNRCNTGFYHIQAERTRINNIDGMETIATFNQVGGVELYFNDVLRFQTSSSGIDITGHVETDTLNVSGLSTFLNDTRFTGSSYDLLWDKSQNSLEFKDETKATFGDNRDLQISHTNSLASQTDSNGDSIVDGWTSYIHENGTGALVFKTDGGPGEGAYQFFDTAWRPILKLFSGTDARAALYHSATERLVTTSGGIDITGHVETDTLNVSGIATINQLHVTGISTFVGVGTFYDDLHIKGDLFVVGDIAYDEVTGVNMRISGIATINDLHVTGISSFVGVSTFHNGFIVSGVSTFNDGFVVSGVSTFNDNIDASTLTVSGISTFDGAVELDSTLIDIHGEVGVAKSILTSTGAGVSWADAVQVTIGQADRIKITDDTTGSGTHYIHFGSATSGYDGVEVDSGGLIYKDDNFGVGTNNPTKKLEVYNNGLVSSKIRGNVAGGLGAELILQNENTAANGYTEIQFQDANADVFSKIRGFNIAEGWDNGYLSFYTSSASEGLKESLRITDLGDVGIGTNNPIGVDALTNNTKTLAVGIVTANTIYVGTLYGTIEGPVVPTGDLDIEAWIRHVGDTNTKFGFPQDDTFTVNTENKERIRITSGGLLQVNSGANAAGTLRIGGNYDSYGQTNATDKLATINMPHYSSDTEEPIQMIRGFADSSNNLVQLGGGTNSARAATELQFFTASNTTQDGSKRLIINKDGKFIISPNTGTTTPFDYTGVYFDSDNSTVAEGLFLNNISDNTGNNVSLSFSTGSGNKKKSAISHVDTGNYGRGDLVFSVDPDADNQDLDIRANEILRIRSTGHVGIGSTIPIATLDIAGSLNVTNVSFFGDDITVKEGLKDKDGGPGESLQLLQSTGSQVVWANPSAVTIGQADAVKTTENTTDASFYLTFVDSNNGSGAYEQVFTGDGIKFNPSTSSLEITGNVSIGGTLTYEDVTNVDSIGLVTARTGVRITSGGLIVTAGISTFGGHLYPAANETYNIGESDSNRFNAVYAKEFRGGTFYGTIDPGTSTISIASSLRDVLNVTSNEIYPIDAGADKIVFWDESATELTHLSVGTGLSITGTTITATSDAGKTYTLEGVDAAPNFTLRLSDTVTDDDVTFTAGTNISFGSTTTDGVTINAIAGAGMDTDATTADVLTITGAILSADNPSGAYDRIIFWDESETKLTHLTVGTGLSITDSTITATSDAGKTYTLESVDSGDNAILRLSDGSTNDDVTITAGAYITIDPVAAAGFTISADQGAGLALDATVTDVFDLTSGTLSADDPGADRIVFWDETASKLTHLTVGDGLQIDGTELKADGSGGDTTYTLPLTGGAGTTGHATWTLTPSSGTSNSVTLNAGTGVDISSLDTTGPEYAFTINADSGTIFANLDVKQYSDEADPRTVRTCSNPIDVVVDGSNATIGIGSTSNAYGTKYVQADDPTTADGGSHTVCEGDIWYDTTPGADEAPGTTKVAVLWEQKTAGTDGGTFTQDAWQDRVLNSKTDPQTFVSWPDGASTGTDGTNTYFSLESGTYHIEWSAPAATVSKHKTRLIYSLSDTFSSPTYINGSSEFDGSNIDPNSQTRSIGETVLTVTEKTYFKIEHQCSVTQADYGLGYASDFSVVEVYTQVRIEDLATAVKEGTGGISGITIKDQGSALSTVATTLNFTGAGVEATGTGAEKTITISGGGGGGATNLSNTANGTSLTIESSTGTNTALPAATTSAWGVMTDDDKTNLDANTAKVTNATHTGDVTGATALTIANDKIEEKHINAGGTPDTDKVLVYDAGEATNWRWATQAGGGGGGATNLSNTANGTSLTINSSTGDNTSLPAATTSAWGVMTDEDKTNLDANTAKVTNANHTGDVTGATALTIANEKIEYKHLNAGGTPAADKVLVYDVSATGKWKWADQSTSPTRTTASATTGSLAADASADLSITGFKSYALLKIAINHPAWVVLYTNDTTRTADDSRAEGTDPTPGSGVLAEVITTTAGASTFVMSPGLIGWNDDGTPSTTVYAKVKNKDSSSRAITVTLTLISMES